jgi:hypothetical protein
MNWFEAERTNLMSALEAAMRVRHDDIAWRLPAVMYGFFELHAYWTAWRDIHEAGVSAARTPGPCSAVCVPPLTLSLVIPVRCTMTT